VDSRERDRVLQHAWDEVERKRAEHAERGDSSWLPTAEEAFPIPPKRSFTKFCLFLFPTGIHPSFGGSYYEGDIEPPCRLFERHP
jgi:hypothetical protein